MSHRVELFDSSGRLYSRVCPLGEVLTFAFDAGGNLRASQGIKQGRLSNYLTRLDCEKCEQSAFMNYGGSISARYGFSAQSRRLANPQADSAGRKLQDLSCRYDSVGN